MKKKSLYIDSIIILAKSSDFTTTHILPRSIIPKCVLWGNCGLSIRDLKKIKIFISLKKIFKTIKNQLYGNLFI